MGLLLLLGSCCFLAAYFLIGTNSLALPLDPPDNPSLLTITSPVNASAIGPEQCTSSLIWTGSTAYDHTFTQACYQAWTTFLETDMFQYKATEFEFLYQGASSMYPSLPTMITPRRYIQGGLALPLVVRSRR